MTARTKLQAGLFSESKEARTPASGVPSVLPHFADITDVRWSIVLVSLRSPLLIPRTWKLSGHAGRNLLLEHSMLPKGRPEMAQAPTLRRVAACAGLPSGLRRPPAVRRSRPQYSPSQDLRCCSLKVTSDSCQDIAEHRLESNGEQGRLNNVRNFGPT